MYWAPDTRLDEARWHIRYGRQYREEQAIVTGLSPASSSVGAAHERTTTILLQIF
jgi:hypothetical protein